MQMLIHGATTQGSDRDGAQAVIRYDSSRGIAEVPKTTTAEIPQQEVGQNGRCLPWPSREDRGEPADLAAQRWVRSASSRPLEWTSSATSREELSATPTTRMATPCRR